VHGIDPELIQLVPDHSDAVIAALAYKIKANILTRDKHHLFTVELKNYFSKQGITVQNNM
jgi:predicted nucleic acid-binding protein